MSQFYELNVKLSELTEQVELTQDIMLTPLFGHMSSHVNT